MTTRAFRWGVASLVEQPMGEVASRARHMESAGFTDMWVPDERLLRNVYIALATIAESTTSIGMGPGVTNPYTRHPAHTAAAIATLDELSGGRATLAFGAGGGLDAYGITRTKPVDTLREAIHIVRELTAGGKHSFEGKVFSLRGAGIDFPTLRQVPIYVAARGPKLLELAGEVADGVIIGGFAEPAGIGYAQELVRAGLERSGRPESALDTMSWLYTSASDDPRAARTAVSKIVLASLINSRPILDRLGVVIRASLRDHLDARGWRFPTETPEEASALLTDDILDAFAIYGTPEQCRAKLAAVRACGIDHVTFVLFPEKGKTYESLATRIASEVVSPLLEQSSPR